ncbi:MAG: S-layer homology domain-containing protein [Acidimicrobiales bacterium]
MAAAAVLVGLASPAGAVAGFGDVPPDQFYTRAVQWMVDSEITSGVSPGCFSPGTAHRGPGGHVHPSGRGAALEYPVGLLPRRVAVGLLRSAVAWMVSEGITTGTSPSTFSPDRMVTRGELATFCTAAGSPKAGAETFVDVGPGDFYGGRRVDGQRRDHDGTTPTTFARPSRDLG